MKLHAESPLCRAKLKLDVEELGPKGSASTCLDWIEEYLLDMWVTLLDLYIYIHTVVYKPNFVIVAKFKWQGFCQAFNRKVRSHFMPAHMQDWANLEAANQKNLASAIIFLARRNERARPIYIYYIYYPTQL